MKTKRRTAWAIADDAGRVATANSETRKVMQNRADHMIKDGTHWHVFKMVEARPGDVVLSREGRRTLAAVVDWMRASNDTNIKVQVSPELDALLRGGQ